VADPELPPGEKWRLFELQAMGLREFARVDPERPLNPFALARFANLLVVDIEKLKHLSPQTREHLLGAAEEICHVFLGHQANRLAIIANDDKGKTLARDYRKADEEAAYATGAAALVPYRTLRKLVLQGREAGEIARRFRVSKDLVEYRLKVTRLWKTYKSAKANSLAE
jgi:leucyl aminopeptidase (aminopeptidase T)